MPVHGVLEGHPGLLPRSHEMFFNSEAACLEFDLSQGRSCKAIIVFMVGASLGRTSFGLLALLRQRPHPHVFASRAPHLFPFRYILPCSAIAGAHSENLTGVISEV